MNRSIAFNLLELAFEVITEENLIFIDYILKVLKNAHWRKPNNDNWGIEALSYEKSSTGYVGINNLGCICYMNSTLQ